MSAEKEIDRLEREINAMSTGGGGLGKSGPPKPPGGNNKPSKPGGDAPLALIGILIAISVLLPAAGLLSPQQRNSLSAGAAGAAAGIAVGFALGRRKK